jgi:hypothetical protein
MTIPEMLPVATTSKADEVEAMVETAMAELAEAQAMVAVKAIVMCVKPSVHKIIRLCLLKAKLLCTS